jgi:hypothetical protein
LACASHHFFPPVPVPKNSETRMRPA